MMKKYKKIIVAIFLILNITIDIPKIYAATFSAGMWGDSSTNNKKSISTNDDLKDGDYDLHTVCEYGIERAGNIDINLNLYNTEGEAITTKNFDSVTDIKSKFLAGTYIGINVYEYQWYKITSSYEVTSQRKTYTCRKRNTNCPISATKNDKIIAVPLIEKNNNKTGSISQLFAIPTDPDKGGGGGNNNDDKPNDPPGGTPPASCEPYSYKYNQTECKGDYKKYDTKLTSHTPTTEEIEWCQNQAKPSHVTLSPSYKVNYRDSNDIEGNSTPKTNVYKDCEENGPTTNGGAKGTVSVEKNCTFNYDMEKTCINVKNGNIRYIKNNEQCSKETDNYEYEVKKEKDYWKYFIPLNATSATNFSFSLGSSSNLKSKAICKDVIKKYDYYASLIVDKNHDLLPGITKGMTDDEKEAMRDAALDKINEGCYYQTQVIIPIVQKFYNEQDNGINFKGFNFYYKPIDINNPFPNGVSEISLWNEWNKNGNNFKNSYNTTTYIAYTNGSELKIRNYNKNLPYTSWDNMYMDGRSQFIQKTGIIVREDASKTNSFYKLGCGPKNTNVTNAFQQKECDTK